MKSKLLNVWVINNSKPRGNISLTLTDSVAGKIAVTIPVTFIPIDLTTQATKDAIVANPTFRKLVSMRMILICSEDYANSVMSTPEGEREHNRIYNVLQSYNAEEASMSGYTEVESLKSVGEGQVSGFALTLCSGSELSDDDAMAAIRGQEGVLTKADYSYIAANSPHAKVKSFAAAKLTGE